MRKKYDNREPIIEARNFTFDEINELFWLTVFGCILMTPIILNVWLIFDVIMKTYLSWKRKTFIPKAVNSALGIFLNILF